MEWIVTLGVKSLAPAARKASTSDGWLSLDTATIGVATPMARICLVACMAGLMTNTHTQHASMAKCMTRVPRARP